MSLTILNLAGGSAMEQTPKSYSPEMQEAIRRRATELYRRSGEAAGRDTENWYQAEAEIIREFSQLPARSAVVVKVQGVAYTGVYAPAFAEGYQPGEWQPGDPVPVRISGNKLFLRRPNGRYLETVIKKSASRPPESGEAAK